MELKFYLANCPCCGGDAEIDDNEFGIFIRCAECGLNNSGEYAKRLEGNYEEAIKKWNMRLNPCTKQVRI